MPRRYRPDRPARQGEIVFTADFDSEPCFVQGCPNAVAQYRDGMGLCRDHAAKWGAALATVDDRPDDGA